MVNSNHITALEKLIALADWVKAQPGVFTASQAAEAHGMALRTVYRYLACLMVLDERLAGASGVGYLYRTRKGDPPCPALPTSTFASLPPSRTEEFLKTILTG